MGKIFKGLFGGGGDKEAKRQAEQARLDNQVAMARQRAQADVDAQQTGKSLAGMSRAPRGQRLLISSERGGLASTLGG